MNAKKCKTLRRLFTNPPSSQRTYVYAAPNNVTLVNRATTRRAVYQRAKKAYKNGTLSDFIA